MDNEEISKLYELIDCWQCLQATKEEILEIKQRLANLSEMKEQLETGIKSIDLSIAADAPVNTIIANVTKDDERFAIVKTDDGLDVLPYIQESITPKRLVYTNSVGVRHQSILGLRD